MRPDPERGWAAEADVGEAMPWPENATTASVFFALETQWAWNDFSGQRRGLRYEAVTPFLLDCLGVAEAERAATLAGVRVMERAALAAWRAMRG